MHPDDYTDEILDREFALVLCRGVGDSPFHRSKNGAWGIPPRFTLREARDGLPLPKNCSHWAQGVTLSKTNLEKLRRLKPGKKAQMSHGQHDYNNWWALRLDGDAEENLEDDIQAKEAELQTLQAQIKKLAGQLIKKERKLQKELRELRKKQVEVA